MIFGVFLGLLTWFNHFKSGIPKAHWFREQTHTFVREILLAHGINVKSSAVSETVFLVLILNRVFRFAVLGLSALLIV